MQAEVTSSSCYPSTTYKACPQAALGSRCLWYHRSARMIVVPTTIIEKQSIIFLKSLSPEYGNIYFHSIL